MVDSFKGRKSGERSLESKDSCRGIGNSLEQLLFSFERPGRVGGLGSEIKCVQAQLSFGTRTSIQMETHSDGIEWKSRNA
jgi:hypothetical protein